MTDEWWMVCVDWRSSSSSTPWRRQLLNDSLKYSDRSVSLSHMTEADHWRLLTLAYWPALAVGPSSCATWRLSILSVRHIVLASCTAFTRPSRMLNIHNLLFNRPVVCCSNSRCPLGHSWPLYTSWYLPLWCTVHMSCHLSSQSFFVIIDHILTSSLYH